MSKFFAYALAAACTVMSQPALAVITVYTNEATFLVAIKSPGVDGFNGISLTSATASPLMRSAGAYSYTGTTSITNFFGAGTAADPWLSTNNATAAILFNNFTSSVSGVGGLFFCSNIGGLFTSGSVTVSATDSQGASATQTINGATPTSFLGFVSDGLLTSVSVSAVQSPGAIWPTVDNLTMGTAKELFANGFE
jgi:hypothetical protein